MAIINGTSSTDSLTGTETADTVNALADNDTVNAGGGNDTIFGGSGNDSLNGEAGDDLILGEAGNDTLNGGTGNDTLDGGTGDDSMTGGDGNDRFLLVGGFGTDTIVGGETGESAGDTIDASGVSAAVTVIWSGADTAKLTQGGNSVTFSEIENLVLTGGADSVNATLTTSGINADGAAGNDTLTGGSGADTLLGGDGADSLTGNAGADSLSGGAGNDSLFGGSDNDLLFGGDGNDNLYGGTGSDTMVGGAGADTFDGGQGLDYVDYSASAAAVTVNLSTGLGSGGDAAGDVYVGTDGIIGSAFGDLLTGYDGASTLAADPYTNVIYGAAGNDTIFGLDGGDSLFGGNDNDSIVSGGGNDTSFGDAGNDTLSGDAGADLLYGGAGADSLLGGTGMDTLDGGAGADIIDGGADQDYILGGIGDTVSGGETGADKDTLDLTAWGWTLTDIAYDPLNRENGTVTFYDAFGAIVGTMNFTNIEQIMTCFTPGTRIMTDQGPRAIETLQPGDLIETRDHGLQPLRWIGGRDLSIADLIVRPQLRPIRISAGSMGRNLPARDLLVSPQHRMLVEGAPAEMLFGEAEVLVAALHMTLIDGVDQLLPMGVRYLHLLFDAHEIIRAEGAWTESFLPADRSFQGMDGDQRAEIAAIFPEMQEAGPQMASARRSLKSHEARALLAA